MKIRFWGVRGSIPCPGPDTVKYGGNTPCIEIRFEDLDRLIIIDAGSGIRELGNDLMTRKENTASQGVEIFITHTHWDHIQGFPFFSPIYNPDMKIRIYGPTTDNHDTLKDALGGQLSYRYFPVRHSDLAADLVYTELKEGRFDLGDGIILTTKYLSHPILCLGYRFEYRGKVVCTAYDTEPFQNLFRMDPEDPSYDKSLVEEGEQAAGELNQGITDFYSGADLLIHDAQYTTDEYAFDKAGWGHSPMEHVVAEVRENGVKHLALFHHDPARTDAQLDRLMGQFSASDGTGGTEVFFAREGVEIEA